MKMQKRLLSILIIAITLLLMVVAFTSCGKCDHEWGEWTVTKPATCLEEGEKVRVCKHDSSHTETAVIEKLPHDFEGNYETTVEPTCVINGTQVATCKTEGCTAKSTIIAPALEHNYVFSEHFAGDCVTPASDKYICDAEGCGAEKIEITEGSSATGAHNYGENWICENAGCNAAHPVEAEYNVAATGTLVAKVYIKSEYNAVTNKNKNVYYLVFEGDGEMMDFTADNLPWNQYARRIERVSIDANIASVGTYALANLPTLTNVVIPEGIGEIPEGLFYNSQITSISIPLSVSTIGKSAFEGCTKLENVSFVSGSRLGTIEKNAFYGCTAIESVDLPEYLENIGEYAFANCTKLTSLNISENAARIASNAFDKSGFRAKDNASQAEIDAAFINYFEGGEYLPIGNNDYAIFLGIEDKLEASIRSIVLHKDVVTIAYGALNGANNLEFISVQNGNSKFAGIQNCIIDTETKTLVLGIQSSEIPNDGTVNKIGEFAFLNCTSLKKIVIPGTITLIEGPAFKGCTSLVEISVPFTGKSAELDNNAFSYIFGDPEDVPATLATVKITDAQTIYTLAFDGCNHIKSIYLPTSLKTIQYSAFLGCTRLESVYVDSIDFWFNVDFLDTYSNPFGYANYLYVNGELLETLVIPEGITEIKYTAFAGCDSITSIVFSSTVTKIANAAFKDCSSLQQVVIPNTVTDIGTSVFANCESLESVTLPEGLTYIPSNTFVACTNLYEIYVGAAIENIDTTAFLSCLSLSKITVAEGNANYASMDGILYNKALDEILFIPHAIEGKITISSGITSIPAEFFANYPELDELVIPESVTSIGKDAFKGCTSLKSITLPFIGESAASLNKFSYVFGTVPSSLEKVVITKATAIKDEEFAECSGIKEIHLPEGVTTIGNSAFKNCYGLTAIIIPASVTEIKDGAFEGCIRLSSIYYGSTAEAYKNITVGANNVPFNNARKYYYNTTVVEEAAEGSFWYLDDKGAIVIW